VNSYDHFELNLFVIFVCRRVYLEMDVKNRKIKKNSKAKNLAIQQNRQENSLQNNENQKLESTKIGQVESGKRRYILALMVCIIMVGCGYLLLKNNKPITPEAKVESMQERRIIAVGDLHGDLANTLHTFKIGGIIDDNHNWAAGNSIFVQTGDVVDRGADTIALYQLMIKLRKQAKKVGGQVIPLLGNHEVLNMALIWNYVVQEDIASFGGVEQRIHAFSKEGWIGKYLRSLGIAAIVNQTVFFHGGANPNWSKLTVDGMNTIAKESLLTLSALEIRSVPLFGEDGPLWYRGFAQQDESEICSVLETALAELGFIQLKLVLREWSLDTLHK
jgi:hypothetical protein